MTSIVPSDTIVNNVLNNDLNISCVNPSSKRILNRVSFDKSGKQISGVCSGLKLSSDVGSYKKDDKLDLCDCQVASLNNKLLTCPQNKFMVSISGDNKSALCCNPCINNINTVTNPGSCLITMANNCPENSYITSVLPGKTITCCYPSLNKTIVQDQEQQNKLCRQYGLSNCSNTNINNLENRCKAAGITDCSVNNINLFQQKCNQYGLRYNDINGNLQNSNSPIDCDANIFPIIDSICKSTNIKPCTVNNISNAQINLLKDQINLVRKLDSISLLILPTSVLAIITIILFIIIKIATKN